jgi:hypothetical protein
MRLASGGSPRDVLAMRRVGTLLLDLKRTPPQDKGKLGREIQLGSSNDRMNPEPQPSEYAASLEAARRRFGFGPSAASGRCCST